MLRRFFLLVGLLTFVSACAGNGENSTEAAVVRASLAITGVAPGVADWNTQITVTGSGFGAAGGFVLLNKMPALVEGWTDTEVKFRVPTALEPGYVTLTLAAGEAFAASTLGIRPTIVTASASGRVGEEIVITGHNLGHAGRLSLVGDQRTELNAVWSPTGISATVPRGIAAGQYTLEVSNEFAVGVSYAVGNSLPSLAEVALGAGPFFKTSTLEAVPSGWSDADDDGPGYQFQWHRNGLPIVGATSDRLTGLDFEAGDQIFVRVIPDDSKGTGLPIDSATVTIANSAPVVAAAYIADAAYTAASKIHVTPLGASDADGETVVYSFEWYVNGLLVAGQTTAAFTGTLQRNDVVYARITPADGVQTGQPIESNSVTIGNLAPSIAGVYVGPAPFYVQSTLTAQVNGWSDLDGDAAQYRYEWYVDGVAVAGQNANTLAAPHFAKGREVFATVVPSDGISDGAARNSNVVRILNSAPIITAAQIPAGVYARTSTITAAATGWSDADGDAPSYLYQWKVNGKAVAGATGTSFAAEFVRGDLVSVTMTPFDGESTGASIETAPVTIVNSQPVVAGVSLGSGPFDRNATLTATLGATADADGDSVSLEYIWYKNGSVLASETAATLSGSFQRGDQLFAEVRPFDGIEYGPAATSAVVTIVNFAPTLASASLGAGPYYVKDTLAATTSGFADQDGDAPQYSYAWYVNGSAVVGETASTLAGQFVHGDTVFAVVTPYDGFDYGAAASTNTVTIQNTLPSVTGADIGAGPYSIHSALGVIATGWSDADNDPEGYQYQWYVNGLPAVGEVADTFSGGFTRGDAIFVQITPDDGIGTGAPVNSNTVTIQNTIPSTTGVALGAGPFYRSSTLAATVDLLADADGDIPTVVYAWYKDGLLLAGETNATLSGVFQQGDLIYVEATPYDGFDYGATVTSTTITIANQPPSLLSASIGAGPYYRNSTITVTPGGFSDADGDAPQYKYAWYVNGTVAAGQTTASLSGAFVKGNQVYAVVTPYDGVAEGAAVTSSTVTIANIAPLITGVDLGAGPFDRNSTLSATITGFFDEDGDLPQYTFEWNVNGSVLPAATLNSLSGFVRGDVVSLKVTPFDGSDSGTPVIASQVTIGNAAPVITAVSVDYPPYSPTLTAAVTAYDPDGDPLTYAWGLGGVRTVAPGSATSTVLTAPANNGSWLMSAYVSDSTDTTEGTKAITTLTAKQWASYRGSAQNTGRSPYASAATGVQKWTAATAWNLNAITPNAVAIDENGILYVTDYGDQGIFAFRADGTEKWKRTMLGSAQSAPLLLGNMLITTIGYGPVRLRAFNRETGVDIWSLNMGNQTSGSPALGPDGTVYIGDSEGNFYAAHATNGALKWSKNLGSLVYTTAAFAPDGTVYAAANLTLYALNPTDGSMVWSRGGQGQMFASPPAVANDGTIYIGSNSGVWAMNPDGSLKWRYDITWPGVRGAVSIGPDGTIYAAADKLYALSPSNGILQWTYNVPQVSSGTTVVDADGTVYTGGTDGYLYAIRADGTLKWRYLTGSEVKTQASIGADGTVYIAGGDNLVHAIK